MKYLKTFENSEELEFGVIPEDIKYLFTDISDNGWLVNVRFLRKLFDFKRTNSHPILKFGLIPSFWKYFVYISRNEIGLLS